MSHPHDSDVDTDRGAPPLFARDVPDATLTERMRAGSHADAVREFKRRHRAAARAYAALCTRHPTSADELADEALEAATAQVVAGHDAPGTWRQQVLLVVQRAAADWLAQGRERELDPAFVQRISQGAVSGLVAPALNPDHLSAAVLRGYFGLSAPVRTALWHGEVEREPLTWLAARLGRGTAHAEAALAKGRREIKHAFVHAYLEDQGTAECRGFRRIFEVAGRPDDQRHDEAFIAHLGSCPGCTVALTELARLWEEPRAALAEGLLGWAAHRYVTGAPNHGEPSVPLPQPGRRPVPPSAEAREALPQRRHRRRGVTSARWPLVAAAAALLLAGTVVLARQELTGGSSARRPVRSRASAVPSAGPSPRVSVPGPPTAPATPPTAFAKDVYTRVMNVASGRCLDIDGASPAKGRQVITAPCDDSATQQWRLSDQGLVASLADPALCLDTDSADDRGASVRPCAAPDEGRETGLLVSVDQLGRIRPRSAPLLALTPHAADSDAGLSLCRASGRRDQRWTTTPTASEALASPVVHR
ncbi:ricin-type beta-trefoil lectin domain protein [Streptomyces sp. ICBB 8177]|uniref:ricin-type beta-trefoil lectin domain protein n=1 Tax=Streptomyces sp. ICBB 8177 TaxID=563922 RepID=UPI000D672605|nr:ricin-type beta-trefoil lectin domain protein [Streptomyces sp. ICBB 8177]PWI44960.1 hypothetical protein CK485_07190 [Streptomyces sp. ICBB 8177]